MKKTILFSIAGIAIILLTFAAYLGYFSSIKITEKQIGPYFMVIEDHAGDYAEAPTRISKIDSVLKLEGIKAEKSFGIYRNKQTNDNKQKTKAQFGVILEPKDNDKVPELQKKGFIIFEMGLTNAVGAEFPYRNKYSLHIGGMKIYPAFEKYCKEKNYKREPIIEIYSKEKILYAMEIKK